MSKSLGIAALALSGFALIATDAFAAEFGKLVKVAGDRQIVVGPFTAAAKSPFTVRVLDSDGAPIVSRTVHIQNTSTEHTCTGNRDEFGFLGFHMLPLDSVCGTNGSNRGFSDSGGFVTLNPSDFGPAPSAFLIGAMADIAMQPNVPYGSNHQFFSIVRVVAPPAGQPQVVVEYFHDGYRNYFNTIDQAEIDALDAGSFAGWTREVGSFIAWPSQAAAPPGAVPVCRFFGSVYASHFYTADPGECDAVVANYPDWQLETREAFWIFLPDKETGACAENLMPVYRVLKPTAPNHRYVTDRNVRDTMVVFGGWIAEGYGPDAVIMCTPR